VSRLWAASRVLLCVAATSCSPAIGAAERVWINRTETPIEVQEGVIPACSSASFTQAQLDQAFELRSEGLWPSAPPGTVVLDESSYAPAPEGQRPLIIVVLADGVEQYFFVRIDESATAMQWACGPSELSRLRFERGWIT
jgi:hypothetical protein